MTLVGCSAAAADELASSAAPDLAATVAPPSAEVTVQASEAPTPDVEAASASIAYGADIDLDAVVYPDSLQGDELANAREWMQTNAITAQCMKEQGYDYTFTPYWAFTLNPEPSWIATLPEEQQAAARGALDGSGQTPGGYRWEDAGCWGYAVHVMGNDNAH